MLMMVLATPPVLTMVTVASMVKGKVRAGTSN